VRRPLVHMAARTIKTRRTIVKRVLFIWIGP
jgi:hypothetical protein